MKYLTVLLLASTLLLLLCACQSHSSVCPPGSVTFIDTTLFPTMTSPTEALTSPTPASIELGNGTVMVNRIVHGPLCNDTWSGTVYVACDVQVAKWVDKPTFFSACNLAIEPGTIVYVAAHNNAAFYSGCSCHTGEGTK
jgi:hypothetical protein